MRENLPEVDRIRNLMLDAFSEVFDKSRRQRSSFARERIRRRSPQIGRSGKICSGSINLFSNPKPSGKCNFPQGHPEGKYRY